MKRLTIISLILGTYFSGFAQETSKRLNFNQSKEIIMKTTMNYLLYFPENYKDTNEKYPFILFLHGSGERGNDLNLVKKNGLPKLINEGKNFPFIIVSPQCPVGEWWNVYELNSLIDELIKEHRIDEQRIYVTGLSMGGFGTWELAMKFPRKFAAIAPICGGGSIHDSKKIKHLPIWAFHGAKDEIVPLMRTVEIIDHLQALNANPSPKLTVYPETGHDAWSETYENPQLYQWFLKQKKK